MFETRPDHAQWGFLWFKEYEIFKATEEDFAKIAADFHKAGITHVMTFSTTHFRWNFVPYWPQINLAIERIVKSCHALGMYVVEHHSCNLFNTYRTPEERPAAFSRAKLCDYPELEKSMSLDDEIEGVKRRDLLQYSGITGEPLFGIYDAMSMCTNNPLFRERYFHYLEDVYRRGVDGIMTDDVEFFDLDSCACPHCRKLFNERTGLELPPNGDAEAWNKMLSDTEGKLFLAWKNFRYSSNIEFHQAVVDHYTGLGLKMFRPNYIATSLSWANPWGYIFDDLPVLDWGFQECCCGAIRYSWPEYVLEAHHRSSVCRRRHVPVMSLYYPDTQNLRVLAWALSLYCGHKYLGTDHTNNIHGEGELRTFEAENFDLLNGLEINAKVGIYDSARSRELDGRYSDETYKMICGTGQACIFGNLPFRIVSWHDWKHYSELKLIVVPSCRFMSDSEITRLGDFMRTGGTLVWGEGCGMGDNIACEMRTREKVTKLLGDSGRGKLIVVQDSYLSVPAYKRAFTYGTEIERDGVHLPSDGPWQPFTSAQNGERNALADFIAGETGGGRIDLAGAATDTLASSFYGADGIFTVHLVNAAGTLKEDGPGAGFGHSDAAPFEPNKQAFTVTVEKPEALAAFSYTQAILRSLQGTETVKATEKDGKITFAVPVGALQDYLLAEFK